MTTVLDEEILAELEEVFADFQPTVAKTAESFIELAEWLIALDAKYNTVCETFENNLYNLPQIIKLTAKMAPALHRPLAGLNDAGTGVNRVVAEVHAALREIRAMWVENRSSRFQVPMHRGRGPTGKTKLGRPSVWKGIEGFLLVYAVKEIRARQRCSLAHAIRHVTKKYPTLKRYKALCSPDDGTLQVRYQEAANYWSLVFDESGKLASVEARLNADIRRTEATVMKLHAAGARLDAELEQLNAAIKQFKDAKERFPDDFLALRAALKTFRNEI